MDSKLTTPNIKSTIPDTKPLLHFLFELGQLRRVRHEGWKLLGIEHPETVAEHSLRAAQIGFILAKLEEYENPSEVCTLLVFHDIEECRVGDIHKVANRYITADREKVLQEQTEKMGELGKEIRRLWKLSEFRETTAGIIAKDADCVEQAITAKEYLEKGYPFAQDWINNTQKLVQTKSAKSLLASLHDVHSNDWWQGLKKL